MRLLAVLAVFVSAAAAHGLNLTALTAAVPKCALGCAVAGPVKAGCAILDLECICSRLPAVSALGAPCMVKAGCKIDDIMKTGTAIVGECEKEYARTHNGSIEGMYALPAEARPATAGGAAAPRGAGWAVASAMLFSTAAMLL